MRNEENTNLAMNYTCFTIELFYKKYEECVSCDLKISIEESTLFEEIAKENGVKGKIGGEAKGIIEAGFDLSENDILERLQKK